MVINGEKRLWCWITRKFRLHNNQYWLQILKKICWRKTWKRCGHEETARCSWSQIPWMEAGNSPLSVCGCGYINVFGIMMMIPILFFLLFAACYPRHCFFPSKTCLLTINNPHNMMMMKKTCLLIWGIVSLMSFWKSPLLSSPPFL